jgi:hypothetical protein
MTRDARLIAAPMIVDLIARIAVGGNRFESLNNRGTDGGYRLDFQGPRGVVTLAAASSDRECGKPLQKKTSAQESIPHGMPP